jgi:acetate kinase
MIETILIVNAGSSSVKFQIFGRTPDLPRLAAGSITDIGTAPVMKAERDETGQKVKISLPIESKQKQAVREVINWIESQNAGWKITAVAHRFVHGGTEFSQPVRVTSDIFHKLKKLIPLAPLHQPHHLAAMGVTVRFLPMVPQIACFDTAFHSTCAPIVTDFAIPKEITDQGVRRYGFHGLSYEWSSLVMKEKYPDLAAGRVVVAHLGNGASLCAINAGKSVDTTMGMTVLDGLPMGTRCGEIDAGAVFYMIHNLKDMGMDGVEKILYTQSGLKGLSGISNDVKTLLESSEPRAKYALDYFAFHIAKHIGSMAASMGGIDGVVFTGGIGENAESVRKAVMAQLEFLKVPRVLVIPANEERLMAMQATKCLAEESNASTKIAANGR